MKNRMTRLIVCAMIGASMFGLTACGSSGPSQALRANKSTDGGYYNEAPAEAYADEYVENSSYSDGQEIEVTQSAATSTKTQTNRKLIRTVNLNVETTDYDSLLNSVMAKISELDGYVEQVDESVQTWNTPNTRTCNMTIRIPKAVDDQLISIITDNSNVTSRTESIDDVTLDYVDMESHKKTLIAERDRLMAFMEQAADVEEMIAIESRLSDVQYQIESLESQLRTYDNKIDYTTIHLYIDEVSRIVPQPKETFWSRISVGFKEDFLAVWNGITGIVEWIIIHIPSIIVFVVVVFIIWILVIKPIKKKIEVENEKMNQRREEARKRSMEMMNHAPMMYGMPPMPGPFPNIEKVEGEAEANIGEEMADDEKSEEENKEKIEEDSDK